jgi:hypothetical protein
MRDPEGAWLAVLCTGILLVTLSATVCLGVVALYHPKLEALDAILACFAVGAILMLVAAARLEMLAAARAHTRR